MKNVIKFYLVVPLLLISFIINSQEINWNKIKPTLNLTKDINLKLSQDKIDFFELDYSNFKQQLDNVPLRGTTLGSSVFIKVPGHNGELETFKIFESSVFAPELAAKYPSIKSYVGYSQENFGAEIRMSISHKGLETMISYLDKPSVFLQPVGDSVSNYMLYSREARQKTLNEFNCSTIDEVQERLTGNASPQQRDADDQQLRRFRLAISVTGEYTQYHGGTVSDAMAAINTTMTRVNAIFETDMAVTFELIANNDTLIYTNANTDPYSNANVGTDPANSNNTNGWGVQVQNVLTNAPGVGNAAYDIGHLFGATGGGGNAGCIGCVCRDDTASNTDKNKGSAYTSPADGIPEGDSFDVDYVAHEIGHQMGANHTWAFSTEGTGVNAEPGSGTTIMGYAGITGANNVQLNSDPYFHYHSIKQVLDNLEFRTCWNANNSPMLVNNPPNADAGNDFVIPQGTAYVLRGSATDSDSGDTLTYCWEQTDSGQVTNTTFGPTITNGSMNRSLDPTNSPNRYIPKLSRVVAGQLTETNPSLNDDWETVATVNRTMNWALTVRDRAPSAVGLGGQSSFDTMSIQVTTSAGPFTVTSQASNVSWEMGTTQTVSWNVANTDAGSVNTPEVNILMSTDGGVTFPITLASNVPNDGSQQITVPVTTPSTQARIIVEGAGNIFYAMNSSNFSLIEPDFALVFTDTDETACQPADAVYNFTYNVFNGFSSVTNFSTLNLPSGAIATFSPASATTDGTPVTLTISNMASVVNGSYTFSAEGTSGSTTRGSELTLNVLSGSLSPVSLLSPSDNDQNLPAAANFTWSENTAADDYLIEIATDSGFTNIIQSATVNTPNYLVSLLSLSTDYFWRVGISNSCVPSVVYSSVFSFSTQSCTVCESVANTDFQTSTTLVNFEDINRVSAKPSGYFDYSPTDVAYVVKESSYPITINANTDGNYRTQTKVWIDWNQNCSFDDAGEEYDLGEADNVPNGATANSGLMIMVPSTALIGNTTMRVSTKYTSRNNIVFPTSCENGADGEVEDYRVNVQENTLSVNNNELEGFVVWPNPTLGKFNVKFKSSSNNNITIDVFDVRGRLILKKQFNNSVNFDEQLDLETEQKGLYIVRVNDGNRTSLKKLLVK